MQASNVKCPHCIRHVVFALTSRRPSHCLPPRALPYRLAATKFLILGGQAVLSVLEFLSINRS